MKRFSFLFFSALLLFGQAIAQDGSRDVSFNAAYMAVNPNLSGTNQGILSMAVQPDDRILIGGSFTRYNNTIRNRVARVNADGSLDPSFTTGSGFNGTVYRIALQPDGKVVVLGAFTTINGVGRNGIARLNSDGSIDNSLNGGEGVIDAYAMDLQADGKIVIAGGFMSYAGVPRMFIARLNADGSLDNSFTPSGPDDWVNVVRVQPDGKILISGYFQSVGGSVRQGIARLNEDGSLDTSFVPPIMNTIGYGYGLDLQADGKILHAGEFAVQVGGTRQHLIRLNANGSLDSTFSQGGGGNSFINAVRYLPNGRILIGGDFTAYDGTPSNHFARLLPNGQIDTDFSAGLGAHGINIIDYQSTGKILIAGAFSEYNGQLARRLARINNSSASISYPGSPYCRDTGTAVVARTGPAAGTYTSSPAGLALNDSTGAINLATSTPGTYVVTYTVSGGSVSTQVIIRPSSFFNTVNNQLVCTGATVSGLNFSSVPGMTYSWTNTNATIGLAPSGTGNISDFMSENCGTTDQSARITVRATGGTGCFVTPLVFGITVAPAPAALTAISNQTVCAGQMTSAVSFTNAQGATSANWTNDNPAIGTVASASNSPGLPSFIARNPTGDASTIATFTVTPVRRGCSGTPVQFTITVNNSVTSLAYPRASYCQNTGALPILRGGAGGTYSATPNGLDIDINTGRLNFWNSAAGTYTVTYTLAGVGGCGSSASTQVTVLPRVSLGVSYQQFFSCRGGTIPELTFSGSPNGYAWTNSNTAIGLGASGSGSSIAAFTAQNPGNTILRSTVTVTALGNGTTTCNSLPIPVYLAVGNCNAPLVTQADGTGGDASTLRTQDVTLSPVPARDRVTVQLTTNAYTSRETYTVQLVSQYGGAIGKPAVMNSNVYTVDLSGLTPGVYTLRITSTRTGQGVQKQVVKY